MLFGNKTDHDEPPTRKELARAMADMDLCIMVTREDDGMCSRPMSNNAQVDWDGDNWFFSNGDTRKVAQLRAHPAVTLDFQSKDSWISLRGRATLHQGDKALFRQHWTKDLDRWFPEGIDTPGLTLIQVSAQEAEAWGRIGNGSIGLKG